jgi:ABC-type Zn uptake system ZnuABC Zn-binding protein ZnuA
MSDFCLNISTCGVVNMYIIKYVDNFRTAIINEDMKLQKEFEDNEKQLMKKLKRVNSSFNRSHT